MPTEKETKDINKEHKWTKNIWKNCSILNQIKVKLNNHITLSTQL